MSKENYNDVCQKLGLKFSGSLERTDGPIHFLGRLYPCPKYHKCSIVDIKRAISKIHMVTAGGQPVEKLANKLAGYLASDPNVPLFSDLIRVIAKIKGCDISKALPDTYWGRECAINGPFPMEIDQETLVTCVLDNLGIDGVTYFEACKALTEGRIPALPPTKLEVKCDSMYKGFIFRKGETMED
jgi:hypothetical protein